MDKMPPKRKIRKSTKEELVNLEKEELVDRIIQLEAHNIQLKNIIKKKLYEVDKPHKTEEERKFDFNKCHNRKVLLHILYFGWDYQGLAVQEDSIETIEHHVFQALTRSCLIDDRSNSDYHRCGRTDKGVSAFGQIFSIRLRSKYSRAEQNEPKSLAGEMPYCKILNRLLPKEIQAVGWMPIPEETPEFSARFDCKKRQYKYYFPKSGLNIPAMSEACSYLIGSHDFRHLCKMDVNNGVTEFRRQIFSAEIVKLDGSNEATSMYALVIEGNAFLWHQIRCIMGVLLLVGEGNEDPSIISELLDVDTHTRKPQYSMALNTPLNLFKCTYNVDDDRWVYDMSELMCVIGNLQNDWTVHSVKTTMIGDCIKELQEIYTKSKKKRKEDIGDNESERDGLGNEGDLSNTGMEGEGGHILSYTECLAQGVKARVYTPLLKRQKCSSLEEKIEYYKNKRKVGETKDID